MNTSVLTDCKSNATPSENNINIKWLKYSAIPIKYGSLYSEYNSTWKEPLLKVNKSLSNTII